MSLISVQPTKITGLPLGGVPGIVNGKLKIGIVEYSNKTIPNFKIAYPSQNKSQRIAAIKALRAGVRIVAIT